LSQLYRQGTLGPMTIPSMLTIRPCARLTPALAGIALALCAPLSGCAVTQPITENQVVYAEVPVGSMATPRAFSGLTARLVGMGYDIKHSDKDAGVLISEYRAVARSEGNPPFDVYLQFRTTVQQRKGGVLVRLIPSVKWQNRLNSLASSEVPLVYYSGEPEEVSTYLRSPWAWGNVEAHRAFEAVVADVAAFARIPISQVRESVQSRTIRSNMRYRLGSEPERVPGLVVPPPSF